MKRIYFLLMFVFCVCLGHAQQRDTTEIYWRDSVTNYERVLNKTKFRDNWFISAQVGTARSWGSYGSNANFMKMFRPGGAISIGKWLAPFGGLRGQVAFNGNRGQTDPEKLDGSYGWKTIGGYVDGLFNLTNICCKYEEDRVFNLIAVLGIGVEHTMDFSDKYWYSDYPINTEKANYLAWRLGLIANFRLSRVLDLNLEAVNNVLDDGYDGQTSANKWDGHLNVFLGLTYRFKNHDDTHQFTYARRDYSQYTLLNDKINQQRSQIEELENNIVTRVEKQIVESNHLNTLISFEENSAVINHLQEVNVFTAAQGLKKMENADLYITTRSKAFDADLFQGRAQAIRSKLVNELNVPAGRIFIEKDPAVVQSLDNEKSCVIIYINE